MSKTRKSVTWNTLLRTDSGREVDGSFVEDYHTLYPREKHKYRLNPWDQTVSRLGYTSNEDRQYDHRRQIGRPRLEKYIKEYEQEIKKWKKDIKNIQKELEKKPKLTYQQYPNKERGDIDFIRRESMERWIEWLNERIQENLEEIAPLKRLLEEDDRLAEDDKLRGGRKTKKTYKNNRKTKKRRINNRKTKN